MALISVLLSMKHFGVGYLIDSTQKMCEEKTRFDNVSKGFPTCMEYLCFDYTLIISIPFVLNLKEYHGWYSWSSGLLNL